MAVTCVNINHEQFKTLRDAFGLEVAKALTIRFNLEKNNSDKNNLFPTVQEATSLLRSIKINQFKKAVSHMRSIKTADVRELLKAFKGIINTYNGKIYVVNGSRISEKNNSILKKEIEESNLTILHNLNSEFGTIFRIHNPDVTDKLSMLSVLEQYAHPTVKPLIKEALKNNTPDEVFQYFVDKAVEDPAVFARDFGQDITDKLVSVATIEELKSALDFLKKNTIVTDVDNQDKSFKSVLAELDAKFVNIRDRIDKNNKPLLTPVISFVKEVLPKSYQDTYKNLYELAARLNIKIRVKDYLGSGVQGRWFDNHIQLSRFDLTHTSPVKDMDEFVTVLNHEIIHGLLANLNMTSSFNIHSKLNDLFTAVDKYSKDNADSLSENIKYFMAYIKDGMREYDGVLDIDTGNKVPNIEEFITIAFTNKEFAEFLNSIPSTNTGDVKTKTIFQELLDIIKEGFGKILTKSALNDIADVMNEFFNVEWQLNSYEKRNAEHGWGMVTSYDQYDKSKINPSIPLLENYIKDREGVSNNILFEGLDDIVNAGHEVETGATFNSDGSVFSGDGIVVPIKTLNTTQSELSNDLLENFINDNVDYFADNNVKIGIYKFANSDKVSIDINIIAPFENMNDALEVAKELGHESVWHTKEGNIKTGGTGESIKEISKKDFEDILLKLTESENKAHDTQQFFSDVVKGVEKYRPLKEWTPLLSFSKIEEFFKKAFDKYKGYFDNHIASSIPTFRETQIKVGSALLEMFKTTGGLIYDIGGSEGGFVKTISQLSEGKIRSINLDPNPDMVKSSEKNPVKGFKTIGEAFYEGFDDFKKHTPSEKADVVHESMTFQFIKPERKGFIKEIVDNYLKEDGILLLEEKVRPESENEWLRNEHAKDKYKSEYFLQEAIDEKSEKVLTGMKKNQTRYSTLLNELQNNFTIVREYWDSGNFKGIVASNSKEKIDSFFEKLGGRIESEYSSENIPNDVEGGEVVDSDNINVEIDEQVLDTLNNENIKREAFANEKIKGTTLFSKPLSEAAVIAKEYMEQNGMTFTPPVRILKISQRVSKLIAKAFAELVSSPNDPATREAYNAMVYETIKQFKFIISKGYTVEVNNNEPYSSSQDMISDLRENRNMKIFSTESGFGEEAITDEQRANNPLLQRTEFVDKNGVPLLANDLFRFVHDFFGHAELGNGFGPVGEENAWNVHVRMYSPLARKAMTTETRGQNSWVNFSGVNDEAFKLRDKARKLRREGKIEEANELTKQVYDIMKFAEQKVGLLPDWISTPFYSLSENANIEVVVEESNLAELANDNAKKDSVENSKNNSETNDNFEYFQKEGISEDVYTAEQKKSFSLNQVIRLIRNKFGIQVHIVNDSSLEWKGKFSKGKIFINVAKFTPDTPFHELFHPFIDYLKQDNPELYNQLIDEVKNSESGQREFVQVQKLYPELSESEQWDEVLVIELGRKSANTYLSDNENKSLFTKFIDWIKTQLAKMGINTVGFNTNMKIQDFADLIVNPLFVFDLESKTRLSEYEDRYSKLSNNFSELIETVKLKLQADVSSMSKNMSEDVRRRKYFSGKTAEALTVNPKDLKAIDNYLLSSAINIKNLNEKFEDFKTKFDAKKVKSKDDLAELSALLNEIEDCSALYADTEVLTVAVLNEFPESVYKDKDDNYDNIANFHKNYKRQASNLISYKEYAKELIVNWIFPEANAAINRALATNNPLSIVSKNVYNEVKDELSKKGVTDKRVILETAFKRELASYLTTVKEDTGFLATFLGPIMHSRDPLSVLIARSISDEYNNALKKGYRVQEHLKKLVRQARGLLLWDSNKDSFDFYSKYLRKAISYEYKGVNEKGEHEYDDVARWAFHEEYFWDKFYKEKRDFEKKLGKAPSKNDFAKYEAWKKAREKWYADNTVSTAKGVLPNDTYKNPDWIALQSDKLFVELYNAYKQANDKVGYVGLKFGIIPQNAISGIKIKKGSIVKDVIEKTRLGVSETGQAYVSLKNDLSERKTVPMAFTSMVDDDTLSFDLLQSVSKYVIAAEKYHSMSNIEPNVNIIKNFIGGNDILGIGKRKAPAISGSGLKILSRVTRALVKNDSTRANTQLNDWLNDVVYGDSELKHSIGHIDAKFKVVDKSGKVEIIRGFSNMAEFIGVPDLDYNGFDIGKERIVKDYTITMLRKDWNLSLNKSGKNLGLFTAFMQLGLNATSATVNIIRGKLETYIEATGGKYFTWKNAMQAEGLYYTALGAGDFFEDIKGGKPSFLSDMILHYDAIQGELQTELGKKVSGSVAAMLFRRSHLFFMQKGGEHYLQTHLMISMMLNHKVRLNSGGTITLYEAKKRENAGTLNLADTDWTSQKDNDFRNRLKFVNTNMHGNYNNLDKAYIQRRWWGQLLLMFRKHMYTAFMSRYKLGYINYQTGDYTQGYYITFVKGLISQFKNLITERKIGDMADEEKYAFKKIAADMAALAILFMLFKNFDDDDDKEEFSDWSALIARRLLSEGVQYTPGVGSVELAKVVINPSASVSTVDKVWDALTQAFTDIDEVYERSGAGYQKGDNKFITKLLRTIPIYRQYVNTVEPERLLQFYNRYSMWFLKPSAGKKDDDR